MFTVMAVAPVVADVVAPVITDVVAPVIADVVAPVLADVIGCDKFDGTLGGYGTSDTFC